MRYEDLEHIEIPGVVVDVKDPMKKGRIKVKVLNVYDTLNTEDIPWASQGKSVDGMEFRIPRIGQVVAVNFINGDIYMPEYSMAEHFNINLQKKLESLTDEEYPKFTAIHFNEETQIFENSSKGLMIDHKMQQINLKEDSINLNLKDNNSLLHLGSSDADQEALLGTHFIEWLDTLIASLRGDNGGPYFGNMGSPVVAAPDLLQVLAKYEAIKVPKFLSQRVFIVDNNQVNLIDRPKEAQTGDKWKSTVTNNTTTVTNKVDFSSSPGITQQISNTEPAANEPLVTVPAQDKVAENSPTESGNSELAKIYNTLKNNKYKIYDRPYELNIVGVRKQYNGDKVSDRYIDDMNIFYKDDKGIWIHKRTKISTMPGKYYFDNFFNDSLASTSSNYGTGIMAPGHYPDCFAIGIYHEQFALKSVTSKQVAFRDKNKDGIINLDPKTLTTGNHSMHIHRGAPTGGLVKNWSAGCQVFLKSGSLDIFGEMCKKHFELYGGKFTYTLLTQRQIDEANPTST